MKRVSGSQGEAAERIGAILRRVYAPDPGSEFSEILKRLDLEDEPSDPGEQQQSVTEQHPRSGD
jgi:hypothetical protein